jgi:putative peptide zinc metalloprotease protein
MSIDRPTFHESWHRAAALRPRLRAGVRVVRQVFRGEWWMVAEDPASGQFYRLSRGAWAFVGRLDGRRTAAEARDLAEYALGDDAPTQGEAIALLAQLSGAGLLAAHAPADSAILLRQRSKRRAREARAMMQPWVFFRVPLLDPDRVLSAVTPLVAWVFSPLGFALWLGVLLIGAGHLIGREREFVDGVGSTLQPGNLAPLFVTFALVKLLHEFGHAAACKVLGRREATAPDDPPGSVHALGVMFFLFIPVPYIDASSAWAFRSKRRRIIVGAAGMMVELAIASIAAVMWARSEPGSAAHALAWNVIILASIGTLAFNLNPLLRFDGYFILSDWLELPNLSGRAFDSLKHLVKRRAWGMTRSDDPARSPGERAWLLAYALLAGAYRVVVAGGILLFIARQEWMLGAALAAVSLVLWVVFPAGRILRYLFGSVELARHRSRAVQTTLGATGVLVVLTAAIPLPRWEQLEAVVDLAEPAVGASPSPTGGERVLRAFVSPEVATPWLDRAGAPVECRARADTAVRAGVIAGVQPAGLRFQGDRAVPAFEVVIRAPERGAGFDALIPGGTALVRARAADQTLLARARDAVRDALRPPPSIFAAGHPAPEVGG